VESLPLAFSSGWASGVNCYLVVLVLGVAERLGYADAPAVLGRWDVLAVAGVLYALEFVTDKIPYVDSTWDAISTVIRPTAGAVVGAMCAGTVPDDARLDQVALAAVGGGTALVSHLVKSGVRLAVNTSPEPASNVLVSVLEDLTVLGLVAFAVVHPRLAAGIAGVLLVLGLVLLVVLARLVRRGWRRWAARRTPVGAAP
jgi:hypothetical protein